VADIDVLACRGDHYTMGIVQGEARRNQLQHMHKALVELSGLQSNRVIERAIRRAAPSVARTVGRVGKRLMSRHLQQHYPEQYDRMLGLAEGAHIPLHHLFVAPAIEFALNRTSYRTPGACTAMAITGAKSRTNEPIIAKNFDYPDAVRDSYLARCSQPAGLAASLEITNAPLCGSHEGLNEHGLAITYNYGSFQGVPSARVTITTLVQEILELCRNVRDAVEYLRGRPRIGGALIMLADADGDIASVEVAPDQLAVRRPSPDRGWLAHANHALTREIALKDIPHDAVFSRWNPRTLRGLPVQESSLRRHERATELLSSAAALGEDDLASMLADHGASGVGDDATICRHGPYYETTCSVLLFPKRRTIAVAFGAPCAQQFSTIAL